MDKTKILNIVFESTLDNIVAVNPSFDKGILKIAYTGLNRNNSFISKDVFEKDINTMFLCPVVANYSIDKNQIGSHDIALMEKSDGNVDMINLTEPVGVVPQSAKWYWKDIEENGTIHEYLCTEVILWKRQPCYQKIKENGITSESMEIDVLDGKIVNGYYQIDDFRFTAFCLLGSAEPCFESASLQLFDKKDFKEQYTQMMKEFKESFSVDNQFSSEIDHKNKFSKKEGKKLLTKDEILKKYNLTKDDIDFEIDNLSNDELETKLKEFNVGNALGTEDSIKINNSKDASVNSKTWKKPGASFLNKLLKAKNHEALVNEAYARVTGDVSGDLSVNDVGYPHHAIKDSSLVVDAAGVEAAYKRAKQQGETGDIITHLERHRKELGIGDDKSALKDDKKFSSTFGEKYNALANVLDPIFIRDTEGHLIEETEFYLQDFDEKYAFVVKRHYTATDSEKTYGRFSYTFDETAKTAKLTSDFEQMVVKWLTPAESAQIDQERGDYAKIKTEFETYKKNHETANADVEVLRTYKADKEKAERKAAIDAIFAKAEFESLKDNKEFNDFKASVGDLKLEDIEEKCYAILGKAQAQGKLNFSVDGKPVTHIKTDMTPEPEDPYGGLFDEFGNKK